jgi:hypothetical protein
MVTNHEYHSLTVAFASAEEECQLLSVALVAAWIVHTFELGNCTLRHVGRLSSSHFVSKWHHVRKLVAQFKIFFTYAILHAWWKRCVPPVRHSAKKA